MKETDDYGGLEKFIRGFLRRKKCLESAITIVPMAADGSVRRFFRVLSADGFSLGVAMLNEPLDGAAERENRAYLLIGRHLKARGIPVPEIYGADLESGLFFMEDLGEKSLQDMIVKGGDPKGLYEQVLDVLLRLQTDGSVGFDMEWCCQTKVYDREVMRRYESDYFRSAFLRGYLGMSGDLGFLDSAFDYIAERASSAGCGHFMHRDFQSRNIIISEGGIGIVDWQGGRMGPLGYDLASLLIDPYTALGEDLRLSLYEYYRLRLEKKNPLLASELDKTYPYLALQRNLQILGAFAFLSKVREKTYFEAYIPGAVKSLKGLIEGVQNRGLEGLGEIFRLPAGGIK
ncbi:phosphotransferase [bacterium]|nr:phosphotransferase [bacterium]